MLDRGTGRVRWHYDIKQDGRQSSFHGDALIIGDTAVIGAHAGNQGHIYAFDLPSGHVRWKRLAPGGAGGDVGIASDIARRGTAIYGVAQGDQLLCLNLNDGAIRWTFSSNFDRRQFGWSNSPVVDGEVVLFAGLDGVMYALWTESGRVAWKTNLDSPISTTPVISARDVYVSTKTGRLYRLRRTDGHIERSIKLEAPLWSYLAIVPNSLVGFGFPNEVAKSKFRPNELLSMNIDLQKQRWIKMPPRAAVAWTSARPYIWKNLVLAGDRDGTLFAIRQTDGSVAWTHQFPFQAIRGIGITKDRLYIGTINGTVYAFEPDTRELDGRRVSQ